MGKERRLHFNDHQWENFKKTRGMAYWGRCWCVGWDVSRSEVWEGDIGEQVIYQSICQWPQHFVFRHDTFICEPQRQWTAKLERVRGQTSASTLKSKQVAMCLPYVQRHCFLKYRAECWMSMLFLYQTKWVCSVEYSKLSSTKSWHWNKINSIQL